MNLVAPATLLPLAAALPEHPGLADSVVYQLNGLVVVFTALGLIWGLLELMALWFKRAARAARPAAVAAVAVAPAPVAPDGLEPQVIAAMAAAVHATLGGSPRITSIVRVEAPDGEWTREGRRQIHSARKVR